jgi:hypothetical protein
LKIPGFLPAFFQKLLNKGRFVAEGIDHIPVALERRQPFSWHDRKRP